MQEYENQEHVSAWVDKNYPKIKRKDVTMLDISFQKIGIKLEGWLVLEEFPNLQRFIASNQEINRITIKNCPELRTIRCNNNEIDELNLGCPKLTTLICNNNSLDALAKLELANDALEELNIKNNDFLQQDLYYFRRLKNLKILELGNDDPKRINQGIYNRFDGSLKHLEGTTNLKKLGIENTDIDSGLECLIGKDIDGKIVKFSCQADKILQAKCQNIWKLFADEGGKVNDAQGWINEDLFFKKLNELKRQAQIQIPPK